MVNATAEATRIERAWAALDAVPDLPNVQVQVLTLSPSLGPVDPESSMRIEDVRKLAEGPVAPMVIAESARLKAGK